MAKRGLPQPDAAWTLGDEGGWLVLLANGCEVSAVGPTPEAAAALALSRLGGADALDPRRGAAVEFGVIKRGEWPTMLPDVNGATWGDETPWRVRSVLDLEAHARASASFVTLFPAYADEKRAEARRLTGPPEALADELRERMTHAVLRLHDDPTDEDAALDLRIAGEDWDSWAECGTIPPRALGGAR